ncbi:MAG: virulence RhuM family protein [Bacteroidales bacterium]|nr:virulence RhuM family protein [Bacteroidales bacterium]
MKNEIILYQPDQLSTKLEVRIEDETVWLTQAQMAELFDSTKQNISLHINNIFKEEELEYFSTVKEYLTVQKEGGRIIKRKINIYNLDVIISVGYRVKSKRGTQFRIWANSILKDYLLKGYAVSQRFERIENKIEKIESKLSEIDLVINTSLPPNQGIYFDGQIFDAYVFVSDLIKSAKKSIILIDNYIDESVLNMLTKRVENVSAIIYTDTIIKQLQLDLQKHKSQYPEIQIKTYSKSHDRFLILDEKNVYHIGASLKDLGKRWFAFSKINFDAKEIINRLK